MADIILVDMVFDVPRGNVSLTDFVGYINHLTDFGYGGILGLVFLMVITSVIYFMTRTNGNERALALAFIGGAVLSIFIRVLNLLTDQIMAMFIVLGFIGLWLLIKEDDKYEV